MIETKEKIYDWSEREWTVYRYERKDLEKMQTRRLIRFLRAQDGNHRDDGWIELEWGHYYIWLVNEAELRDVLSTRPHVPNKIERRNMINSMKKKSKKTLEFKR